MERVLTGLARDVCIVYLDDIYLIVYIMQVFV